MSISSIGGLAAAASAINALVKQEAGEVRGVPRQVDAESAGPSGAAQSLTSAGLVEASSDATGHVDVKA
jgi:hypothetical protein